MKQEIYVSVDIETNGPIPGKNSMLSVGTVAYLIDKTVIGTFSTNLEEIAGVTEDVNTMLWWQNYPEAWKA